MTFLTTPTYFQLTSALKKMVIFGDFDVQTLTKQSDQNFNLISN